MTDLSKLNDVWGIFEKTRVCHCITYDGSNFFGRPMSGVMLEGDTIYSATFKESAKVAHTGAFGRVGFYFYDPEKFHYACLSGAGEILNDRAWKEKLWRDDWSKYFPGGVDDENYVILAMKIENVNYVTEV